MGHLKFKRDASLRAAKVSTNPLHSNIKIVGLYFLCFPFISSVNGTFLFFSVLPTEVMLFIAIIPYATDPFYTFTSIACFVTVCI